MPSSRPTSGAASCFSSCSSPRPLPRTPHRPPRWRGSAPGSSADYGRGQYCKPGADGKPACRNLDELSRLLAQSRNPDSLLDAWTGWQAVGAPMRDRYTRFVTLANAGARHMGFADAGAMWRAGYDMPPDSFVAVVDKLWQQVRPLYVQLHAYVRRQLVARYGAALVPPNGMLPVQLLGNMWGQNWSNIADIALPAAAPGAASGVDLTAILKARNATPLEMFRMGERFYTSLGFDSLPATFWERSQFTRPRDRDVVCHASAWYIDDLTDLRVKMCTEQTEEDFRTIHHELGHDFYFRAYKDQPFLYQNGANDGFHEAIGDAIALSVTPRYLHANRTARLRPRARRRHAPAAAPGARPRGVSAVRDHDRQVALGGVRGQGDAGRIHGALVAAARVCTAA